VGDLPMDFGVDLLLVTFCGLVGRDYGQDKKQITDKLLRHYKVAAVVSARLNCVIMFDDSNS
jgi:hypothetical protein